MGPVSVSLKPVSVTSGSAGRVDHFSDTPVDGLGYALVGMAEELRGAPQVLDLGGCFRPDFPELELADRGGQHLIGAFQRHRRGHRRGAGLSTKPKDLEVLEEQIFEAGLGNVAPEVIPYLLSALNPAAKDEEEVEKEAAAGNE